MLSFLTLALVAPAVVQVALAAPVLAERAATACVAPNPSRQGVTGCESTWTNGVVPGLNLLTAGNFAALSQTGISAVPAISITGNIGVAPAALTYVTGFSLSATGGSYYSTSYMVTGDVYGADSTSSPTPLAVNQALGAYNDASTRDNYAYTELSVGVLDNLSLYKGLYKWSTDVVLHDGAILYLNGDKGDVFIFQSAGEYNFGANSQIVLGGTLTQDSVYFVGATTLSVGDGAQFYGIGLMHNDITINNNAALTGHLYSQTRIDFLKGSSLVGSDLS